MAGRDPWRVRRSGGLAYEATPRGEETGGPHGDREGLLGIESVCMVDRREEPGEDTAGFELQRAAAGPCPLPEDHFLTSPGQREMDAYLKDFSTRKIYDWATAYVRKENMMRSLSARDERAMRNSVFPLVCCSPTDVESGVAAALNHLGRWKIPAEESKASSDQSARLLKNLSALVKRNAMWEVSESDVSFSDFFARKNVDYTGDEVKLAQRVFWPAVCESFPEGVASLDLARFCKLGTKAYVESFEQYLLPEENWVYTKPPRVMIEDQHWPEVCKGLVSKGVCEVFPVEGLCKVGGRPLLNGMFAVGKGEFKGGIETQRLIMNLIPINHLRRSLEGDIGTLPGVSGLSAYLLERGEVALLSSEDIRCFFYLFKVPEAWKRYLGFNKAVPDELVPVIVKGKACVLVSRVLPMGFVNSTMEWDGWHSPQQ